MRIFLAALMELAGEHWLCVLLKQSTAKIKMNKAIHAVNAEYAVKQWG